MALVGELLVLSCYIVAPTGENKSQGLGADQVGQGYGTHLPVCGLGLEDSWAGHNYILYIVP